MTKTKQTRNKANKGEAPKASPPEFLSRKERLVAGKALRETVPRERHAAWKPLAKRRDPIDVLEMHITEMKMEKGGAPRAELPARPPRGDRPPPKGRRM